MPQPDCPFDTNLPGLLMPEHASDTGFSANHVPALPQHEGWCRVLHGHLSCWDLLTYAFQSSTPHAVLVMSQFRFLPTRPSKLHMAGAFLNLVGL